MAENLEAWSFKSRGFSKQLGNQIKGLLLPIARRYILENLVRKGARLKGFRGSPELGGGTAGRGFEPPVGCLPVLLSRHKSCHVDRLEERKKMV